MIIHDIVRDEDNDLDMHVIVHGRNPHDDCDPLVEDYFEGKLGEIPADLLRREVLQTAWSVGHQCHVIEIAYIRTELFNAQQSKSLDNAVSYLSNAIVKLGQEYIGQYGVMNALTRTQDDLIELMKLIDLHTDKGVPLTPSPDGRDCLGNGEHDGIEIQCEDCGYVDVCTEEVNINE